MCEVIYLELWKIIRFYFTLNNISNELNQNDEIGGFKLDTCNGDQNGRSINLEEMRIVIA